MSVDARTILQTIAAATAKSFALFSVLAGNSYEVKAAQIHCPSPPAPVRTIDLTGYYKDKAKSVVDPTALARRRAAVKPLKDYLNSVSKMADRAVLSQSLSRRAGYGHCAVSWLRSWAEGGAYLGRMSSKQAEAQRKWDLAGLSLAYLKIRRYADPLDRKILDPWLQAIADRARAVYDSPGKIRNNHWYWLGLGLGGVGLATKSERHWSEAKQIMQDAAKDISPEGFLPLELKRGKRALHYHTFSVMALVTLAELGKTKRQSWYELENDALHRLVRSTARALVDPSTIENAAGIQQERPLKARAGWPQLYELQFPRRPFPGSMPVAKPQHRWLGGNVLALKRTLSELASSN